MAQIFHYGPYYEISADGALGPGEEDYWSFGPWEWWAFAVNITAHPFETIRLAGQDCTLAVTSISSRVAAPTGPPWRFDRYIYCTVRNVGQDRANYAVYLGGVRP
jgi:hypothetical protein